MKKPKNQPAFNRLPLRFKAMRIISAALLPPPALKPPANFNRLILLKLLRE
jgi:hypothetical protein